MGSTTERLKPLHNFNLPTSLRWGNQRQLRCMKINRSNTQDNDIAAVRQMVMFDLHTAANKIKQNISSSETRPWNLRTRRAAVVDADNNNNNNLDFSKTNIDETGKSSPMQQHECGEKRERDKFSVSLTKKEIEEDFAGMGLRLPRRPKKRPRMVQKQMDTLFPGLWLTEVTADMYKVTEPAP